MAGRYERQRLDFAAMMRAQVDGDQLWYGERPRMAPAGTLQHRLTGGTVDYPVFVLTQANFDRAEQAIALCLAHGLLRPS